MAHTFKTTRWTIVTQAAGSDDVAAQQALATLCESYWYPIYAFFRRSGKSLHDAEDLTQGFFARLLEKRKFAIADRTKGRMRTFLLTDARNFMNDEHGRATAQKRGGGMVRVFDGDLAEGRYAKEPVDDLSPDRLFQRRWAMAIVENSLRQLRQRFEADGEAHIFEALRPFLGFTSIPKRPYEDIAHTLNMPIGSLKSEVSRLRARWKKLLFDQVRDTLNEPTDDEIRAELEELQGCL
jgi:RNA polymerase sigma-70 factor (ECF subfamily)